MNMSLLTYYNSVCFTIIALLFIAQIIIVNMNKKKKITFSNKLFTTLVVETIVIGVIELIMPLLMNIDRYSLITIIACRIYYFLLLSFELSFFVYIVLQLQSESFYANNIKKRRLLQIIFIALISVILIASIFSRIEVLGGVNSLPFVAGGTLLYATYAITTFGITLIITLLSIYKNKLKNVNLVPIYLILLTYVVTAILQVLYNYEVNENVFFCVIIITTLYFTIESQDFKLIDEYRSSKAAAEKANKAKTSFLVNMSHEIRTPMNTIIGFSEILINDQNLTKEVLLRDLLEIKNASNKLKGIIENMIDVSKIEKGEYTLNENEYSLESLIFEINSIIPSKIVNEELKFSIDLIQTMPQKYYGDAKKLFKALTCVLTNAIANTTYGEVKLSVSATEVDSDYQTLNFTVSNTGHTMTKDSFEKNIYDYISLEGEKQKNIDNAKLGLIIAKELLKIIGGEITFINLKGQGTKYIITIKQKVLDKTPIGNIFENKRNGFNTREILDLSSKSILVVDDGRINLEMTKKSLEPYNINVTIVTSGKECIELVQKNKYDVIFIDYMMPEMDGIATVKALNATGLQLPPIVALTANNYDTIKDEYVSQGFDDFLQKPLVFRELNRVMKKLFGNQEI